MGKKRVSEYPKWLDKFGALNKDAELCHYPLDSKMEWHATVFDWLKWLREPKDRFGRRFGVNIFSWWWGVCGGYATFDEAMREINEFQIEHGIPSKNYHIHIQYRPLKIRHDVMQMPLFLSYQLEEAGGC